MMNKIAIIQFGGTGDLTKKKLLPAYKKLYQNNHKFSVLCLGRKYDTREHYLRNMVDSPGEYPFLKYIKYDLLHPQNNNAISNYIKEENAKEVIFYLALSPGLYKKAISAILKTLSIAGDIKKKIVVEKPFGFNLISSRQYNNIILKSFSEKEIYRVDHYLGKEFVQNLLSMRFHNDLIQSVWNKNYIDHIQIIMDEDQGISHRIEFYRKVGIVRDMLQNHIFQIIAYLSMAEPINYTQEDISTEKIKILKSIRKITDFKLGEYQSLRKGRKRIKIPTFVALKLFIDNFDFAGIPFYIKTGKMMNKFKSIIYIQFKSFNTRLEREKSLNPNAMIIEIQPNMRIDFIFNVKKPGEAKKTCPVKFNFDHYKTFKINTPEAYEQIIKRILNSDKTIFPCFREIEESWRIVDSLLGSKNIEIYTDNKLPKFAKKFIQKDKRGWYI